MIGELAALGTAFSWTGTAVCFTNAGRLIGSVAVNHLRMIVALVFLALMVGLSRTDLGAGVGLGAGVWPWEVEAWAFWILAASGLVGFYFGDACMFQALLFIGPRLTTLVFSLWPALAALLGWLVLGEGLDLISLAGMAVTLGSVAWVASERRPPPADSDSPPPAADGSDDAAGRRAFALGILCSFGAVLGQALGFVLAKLGMQVDEITREARIDALSATQIRLVFAIVSIWGWTVLRGKAPALLRRARSEPRAIAWLSAGGFIGPFIGVWLSLVAAQHAAVGVAATLMATTPIWILPTAAVLYGERPSVRAILGALGAVGGVGLLFLG